MRSVFGAPRLEVQRGTGVQRQKSRNKSNRLWAKSHGRRAARHPAQRPGPTPLASPPLASLPNPPLGATNEDRLAVLADGQVRNVVQRRLCKELPLVHQRSPAVQVQPPYLQVQLHDTPAAGKAGTPARDFTRGSKGKGPRGAAAGGGRTCHSQTSRRPDTLSSSGRCARSPGILYWRAGAAVRVV